MRDVPDSHSQVSGWNNTILWQIRHFPNMKHKPQSLTFTLLAVSAAAFATGVLWQVPQPLFAGPQQDETADSAAEDAAPQLKPVDVKAADVLTSVSEKLDSVDSLSCDLHETIVFSGQRFYAVGRYVQASGNRMRLEFRIFPTRATRASDAAHFELDGEPEPTDELKPTGSLQQVSDGSVLWSLWDNAGIRKLTRRNIQQIIDAIPETGSYKADRLLEDLGVGGLQTLLARIQQSMDFGTVREQMVGEDRFLVLSGKWSDKSRKEMFDTEDPDAPLPDYIPDYVRIYIDADASLPRRIQYLKRFPDPSQNLVRPLVTLDLRGVSLNEEVSDGLFTLQVDDEGLVEEDLTPKVIDTIKQLTDQEASGSDDQ